MKAMVRPILYWRGMDADIEALILKCSVCCSHLHEQQKKTSTTSSYPKIFLAKSELRFFEYGSGHQLFF